MLTLTPVPIQRPRFTPVFSLSLFITPFPAVGSSAPVVLSMFTYWLITPIYHQSPHLTWVAS